MGDSGQARRMRNKSLSRRLALLVTACLAGCALAGCWPARWARVEPGQYSVVCGEGAANEAAMGASQGMEIDREEGVVVFALADGSEIITTFVPRERAAWPSGCPTNIHSTHMEVLDIEEEALTIEAVTFSHPILVRACPPEPERVVLREDGEIGGGGGACADWSRCIFFGPARDRLWMASDRKVSTEGATPVNISVVSQDADLDPSTWAVTSPPAHGTVVNNYDGTVTYTPASGYRGTDAFTYRICNFDGTWDTATIEIITGATDDG
jgi:hypothetical protein